MRWYNIFPPTQYEFCNAHGHGKRTSWWRKNTFVHRLQPLPQAERIAKRLSSQYRCLPQWWTQLALEAYPEQSSSSRRLSLPCRLGKRYLPRNPQTVAMQRARGGCGTLQEGLDEAASLICSARALLISAGAGKAYKRKLRWYFEQTIRDRCWLWTTGFQGQWGFLMCSCWSIVTLTRILESLSANR